ncbi:hypothetical protein C8J30_101659 [Rhodobacter viridis]|uniref:Uncharacterized protein n=1 Tax=Rhodobacter viridis TaxID=1054202 RepID=A0A318U442_9RHOB|nr:hypothetical protein C8J30_101659 [Rhodobacter viridis]
MSEPQDQVQAALTAVQTALNALESLLQGAFTAMHASRAGTDHVRAHRPGRASKIEADPELRAFITERIAAMTFAEVVEAVRHQFPPDRQTSVSALHRWWHRIGKHLPGSHL